MFCMNMIFGVWRIWRREILSLRVPRRWDVCLLHPDWSTSYIVSRSEISSSVKILWWCKYQRLELKVFSNLCLEVSWWMFLSLWLVWQSSVSRIYLVSSARVLYKSRLERIFVISLEAFDQTVALKFLIRHFELLWNKWQFYFSVSIGTSIQTLKGFCG